MGIIIKVTLYTNSFDAHKGLFFKKIKGRIIVKKNDDKSMTLSLLVELASENGKTRSIKTDVNFEKGWIDFQQKEREFWEWRYKYGETEAPRKILDLLIANDVCQVQE